MPMLMIYVIMRSLWFVLTRMARGSMGKAKFRADIGVVGLLRRRKEEDD